MNEHEGFTALVLISAAGDAISKRRDIERMCMYPPEYGGDELLLKRIKQFLSDASISRELELAVAAFKKLMKEMK